MKAQVKLTNRMVYLHQLIPQTILTLIVMKNPERITNLSLIKRFVFNFMRSCWLHIFCRRNTEIRSHEMLDFNIAMLLVFAFFQQANRRHMYIVSSMAC